MCASSARWASAYKIMMRHIYITANQTLSLEERNVMCPRASLKTWNLDRISGGRNRVTRGIPDYRIHKPT